MNNKFLILILFILLINSVGYAFSDTTGLRSTRRDILKLEAKKSNQQLFINRFYINDKAASDSFSLITTTGQGQGLKMSDTVKKSFTAYINSLELVEKEDSIFRSKLSSLQKDQVLYFTFLPALTDSMDGELINTDTHQDDIPTGNRINYSAFHLLLALLSGALLMFIYFAIKQKRARAKLKANEAIQMTIKILKSGEFSFNSKVSTVQDFARIATEQYQQLLQQEKRNVYEIDNSKSLIQRLKLENEKLVGIEKEQEERIREVEIQNEEQKNKIYKNDQIAKRQNETAKEFLKNYYYDLVTKIEHGYLKGETEKKKFALKRIIQAAFHSFSHFRLATEEHNASDELNSKILENKPVATEKVISINTPAGSSDEIAYLVMRLLNDYDIEELEGVFIHGYKIGK